MAYSTIYTTKEQFDPVHIRGVQLLTLLGDQWQLLKYYDWHPVNDQDSLYTYTFLYCDLRKNLKAMRFYI